jgi:hypothetical protein
MAAFHRLSIVFQTMLDDAVRATEATTRTGPGAHREDDPDSSTAGSHPHTGSSDNPHPGPATQPHRTSLVEAS